MFLQKIEASPAALLIESRSQQKSFLFLLAVNVLMQRGFQARLSSISNVKVLAISFFDRPTLTVARELLGKFLVRKIGNREIRGMITEVEAYAGPRDMASHASRGRTARTEVMFGKPGHWYIYLIYGMHHCVNIVTEREGYPAAVLIRSIVPFECSSVEKGQSGEGAWKTIKGPGRVCQYFQIDRQFNKKLAHPASGLWIEDRGVKINPHAKFGVGVNPRAIGRGKRIGVDYAGKWKDKLWRFYVKKSGVI